MKNRKLYDALGVSPDATHEQIRADYRSRAKQIHPDNQETGNPVAFERLQIAHSVLSGEESRAHYDATGEESRGHGKSNIEAEALSLIFTISQQIMDGGLGVDCDLTGKIKGAISASLSGHRTNRNAGIQVGEKLIQRIETINRRWSGADTAKAVVIGGLQQRVDQTEAGVRALDATIEIWELAVVLMDGAIYDMPIVKPTAMQMQSIISGWKISI